MIVWNRALSGFKRRVQVSENASGRRVNACRQLRTTARCDCLSKLESRRSKGQACHTAPSSSCNYFGYRLFALLARLSKHESGHPNNTSRGQLSTFPVPIGNGHRDARKITLSSSPWAGYIQCLYHFIKFSRPLRFLSSIKEPTC